MEFQEKLSNFGHYMKFDFHCNSQSLNVFPEAPFKWKNVPDLQVGGPATAPLTIPLFRVVLLHTDTEGSLFFPVTQENYFSRILNLIISGNS